VSSSRTHRVLSDLFLAISLLCGYLLLNLLLQKLFQPLGDLSVAIANLISTGAVALFVIPGRQLFQGECKRCKLRASSEETEEEPELSQLAEQGLGVLQRPEVKQLLDSLGNAVLTVDVEQQIWTSNPEACRIMRLEESALIGQPLSLLPEKLQDLLCESLESSAVIHNREMLLHVGDGETLNVMACASPFLCPEGNLQGALLMMQDQSGVRELEAQLKRSGRLAGLGALSAGMAHEIKNPLVTLKTFTQLLPERFEDEEFRETFTRLAGGEIERIDRLVNQLLTLARPTKPDLQPVALHELLRDHVRWCMQQPHSENLALPSRFAAPRDVLRLDQGQMQKLLQNLFLYAQQAMPNGGEYRVSTRLEGEELELCIQDNGKGIPEEELGNIFDPFFSSKRRGTGLGLAVAHQILKAHHARVDVDCPGDEGTRFRMYFPLVAVEAER